MRNIFVCLILASLVWISGMGARSFLVAGVCLGLFVFFPVVMGDWFKRVALPSHIGPLLAGFVIGASDLVPQGGMDSLRIYVHLGGVFLCLQVGSLLSPGVFLNQKILKAASLVVGSTLLIITGVLIVLWGIPALSAIHLGLICSITAPLFTLLSYPDRKEGLVVSIVTTAISLVIVASFQIILRAAFPLVSLSHFLTYLLFLEISFRTLRQINTEHGKYLFYGATSLMLYLASERVGLSPEFLALLTGSLLRIRGGSRRIGQLDATGFTSLIPFILAFLVAATLDPVSALKGYEWRFVLSFSLAMYLGKGLSAWFASRFLTIPPRDWLQIMPHGFFAILLLKTGLPGGFLTSSPTAVVSASILVNSVGISLLLPLLQFAIQKIKIRRLEAVKAL